MTNEQWPSSHSTFFSIPESALSKEELAHFDTVLKSFNQFLAELISFQNNHSAHLASVESLHGLRFLINLFVENVEDLHPMLSRLRSLILHNGSTRVSAGRIWNKNWGRDAKLKIYTEADARKEFGIVKGSGQGKGI